MHITFPTRKIAMEIILSETCNFKNFRLSNPSIPLLFHFNLNKSHPNTIFLKSLSNTSKIDWHFLIKWTFFEDDQNNSSIVHFPEIEPSCVKLI